MIKVLSNDMARISIGWATIWCKYQDNYWDDVPYRLLEAVDYVNRTGMPKAVQFNGDGYKFIIIFNVNETHIIRQYDIFNAYTIDISIKDVIVDIIEDVRNDLIAWSKWGEVKEYESEERRLDLESWCRVIKKKT